MSIDPHPPSRDLAGFLIQGFFGAILGAAAGLGIYAQSPIFRSEDSALALWVHIGLGALVLGLIAGFFGDSFWKSLKSWW